MSSKLEKSIERLKNDDKSLTTLNIWNNQIGVEGCQALADVIKQNKSLRILDLGKNQIGEQGCSSLAKALKQNKYLTTLYLGYNQIGYSKLITMDKYLSRNKNIPERKKEFIIFLQSISRQESLFLPLELKMIIWEKLISF